MQKIVILATAVVLAACSTSPQPPTPTVGSSPPPPPPTPAPTPSEQEPAAPTAEVQKPDNSATQVISGEVLYRERIALPKGAVVTVKLEDQSKMDAPATVITEYEHTIDGGPPYPFRLTYDPKAIDKRMRYGLRARIENEGKLLFTSTERIDPFAASPGDKIEIIVQSVR